MRTLLTAVSSLVLISLPCMAQYLGNAGVRAAGGVTFVNSSGFGNVVYPGTGGPAAMGGQRYSPVYTPQFYPNQLFPGHLAGTVPGVPPNARQNRRASDRSGGRTGITYPLYVGGGYGSYYAPDYASQTQLVDPQQQYSAPPVVINQYFGPPAASDPVNAPSTEIYRAAPSANSDIGESPAQKYYLLAFKDHSVYSAIAYWIEDKTLHYVTPQNSHNQASLDLVDLDFTKKLNLNHDIPFTPPAAQ